MERKDEKIEDQFVCEECEVHMVKDEVVEHAVNEGGGEVVKKYICKKCFEQQTDLRG